MTRILSTYRDFRYWSAINQQTKLAKFAYAYLSYVVLLLAGRSVADIAVIRWQNLQIDPDGEISNLFHRPPDWSIEILSPEQSSMLVIEKILFCLKEGSELGWLLDPATKSIIVFQNGSTHIYFAKTPIQQPLPMLKGLEPWQITANDIFTWLTV